MRLLRQLWHLRAAHRWEASRIQECQLALAVERTREAIRDVLYYRETFAQAGCDPEDLRSLADFGRLPSLTKETVKAHFPDRLVASRLAWEHLYPVSTSGTSDRVMVFHDGEKRNWDRAADLWLEFGQNQFRPGQRCLELPPDACYEHCGVDTQGRVAPWSRLLRELWTGRGAQRRQAFRQVRSRLVRDYVWRLKMLPSLGVDGTAVAKEVLDRYLAEMRVWRPHILKGLPMAVFLLARRAGAENLRLPNLRWVRPSGGKFSNVMAAAVERAFGVPVRENFGTGELGTIAFDCRQSREQHLLSTLFHVEFVRAGKAVAAGELGEMVITDLRNRATPLIRYRIGDVGRYVTGKCACGFQGMRFVVEGRMDETVVTPEGRVVNGHALVDRLLEVPGIQHVKIRQVHDEEYALDLVPEEEGPPPPEEEELGSALSRWLEHPVRVRRSLVRRIAPERSGKYRLVISTSFARFHQNGV